MELKFQTKEESKKLQQEEFLKLTKVERFYQFLRLSEMANRFPTKYKPMEKDNFIILIPDKNELGKNIDDFIKYSNEFGVRMIMVGGGAVNFHGYQRHSADVDFWIETTDDNFARLIKVFKNMGYEIDDFPESVKQQLQNISIKFSPMEMDIELITRFSINKSFGEAFSESEKVIVKGQKF